MLNKNKKTVKSQTNKKYQNEKQTTKPKKNKNT